MQLVIDFLKGLIRLSLASCICSSIWASSVLPAFIPEPALPGVFLCSYCCLHGAATSRSSQSVVGKRIKFCSYVLTSQISHLLNLLLKTEYLLNILCLYHCNFIYFLWRYVYTSWQCYIHYTCFYTHTHTKLDSSCWKVWQLNKS